MLIKGKYETCPAHFARGFGRVLGLMFKKSFDGALIFEDVDGELFHTFFCRFPILFLFLDKEWTIREKTIVEPWKFVKSKHPIVVELDARKSWKFEVGEKLRVVKGEG